MAKLQFAIFEALIAGSLLVFATAFIANAAYQYSTGFSSRQFGSMNFVYDFATALEKNQSLLQCIETGCKGAGAAVRRFAEAYGLGGGSLSLGSQSYNYSCKSCPDTGCNARAFCFPVIYNKSYRIACISACGAGG